MKKIFTILFVLLIATGVSADFLGIVTRTATRDTLAIPFVLLDTLGNPASLASGDSVYVQIVSPGGVEVYRDSMPFNDASIDSDAWEDFAGGQIYTYTERVSILDGSSTAEGIFTVKIWGQDLTSAALITPTTHTFQMVNSTLESSLDSASLAAANSVLIIDTVNGIIDTVQNQDDWGAKEATLAYFDTLIYRGGVWVDAAAGNTNTVIGIDGTEKNPVSTLAAARTVANALGVRTYYIINSSTLNLAATTESWAWIGVGNGNQINLNGEDVDNSVFTGLTITGTQGGNGSIVLIECDISIIRDFDGHALHCWIVDSIIMDNNSEAFFGDCYSAVAGNNTPTLDFNIASNNVSMRNYSGGINVIGMSDNDNLSLEGNGQLIVDASCTSAPITVRGNFTITDNGTTTALTRDAALNGGYIATIQMDTLEASTTRDVALKSLVISNSAGNAVQFTSTGSNGDGLRVTGNGTGDGLSAFGGSSGAGIAAQASGNNHGIKSTGGTNGDGLKLTGGSNSGDGLEVTRTGSGLDINLSGDGFISSSTDTVQMRGDSLINQGSASSLTKEAIADAVADTLESGTRNIAYNSLTIDNQDANDTAVVIRGNGSAPGMVVLGGASSKAVVFMAGLSSGGAALELQGGGTNGSVGLLSTSQATNGGGATFTATGTGKDISLAGDGFISSATDTVAMNGVLNTDHGATSWITGSSSGVGSDTITVYALDTTGSETAIQDVKITIKNAAGTSVIVGFTNGSGAVTFFLDPAVYTIIGRSTGFVWTSLAYTVSGNDDSVRFTGSDINVGTPSDADVVRVFSYLKDEEDIPIVGAIIMATRISGQAATDTNGVAIIIPSIGVSAFSDTLGYWFIDLRRTGIHADTTQGFYNINGSWDNKELFDIQELYLPDIDNLNLADSLAGR